MLKYSSKCDTEKNRLTWLHLIMDRYSILLDYDFSQEAVNENQQYIERLWESPELNLTQLLDLMCSTFPSVIRGKVFKNNKLIKHVGIVVEKNLKKTYVYDIENWISNYRSFVNCHTEIDAYCKKNNVKIIF